jgi:hypothetical protein
MLFIAHRINSIEELKKIPTSWGVEIDLRDLGDQIIINHDPFVSANTAVKFEDWLSHYRHALLILNVKSEGIEPRILQLIKQHCISNYFFLDCSIPMIHKLINQYQETKIAIRYSEYEPTEFIEKFRGKVDWIWVDCFTKFPVLDSCITKDFKVCLVSPTLQGRPCETKFAGMSQEQLVFVDAVCEKSYNFLFWEFKAANKE